MACHAIVFLCRKGALGHMRTSCIKGTLSFLNAKKGYLPSVPELKALKALIDADPVNEEHISQWFHRNYP